MRICTIQELVKMDFNVVFVNALKQHWQITRAFQCIGEPKNHNLFLFTDGCSVTYTDKSGRTLTAESGNVVYTPIGSEYRARMFGFQSPESHTVGVNFFLFDQDGEPLLLSDSIRVFRGAQEQSLSLLFHQLTRCDAARSRMRGRILLMEIFSALAADSAKDILPDHIARTLQYLAEHIEDPPTVAELARCAHVSEAYFRRQFKHYLGQTPREYRNALRLGKARSYLEYGDISVQEISDTLGYATVSHFIKEFKRQYGYSPLKYRKSIGKS